MVLTRTFMANVRSSQIKIKASEFPAFLYADASKFDPKKPHRGLLKGLLLVRVSDVASTSSCVSLRKLQCIGFPWYLYRPKHCNAKGCAEYFEVTGRDSQDFYRRTIRNCVCCCPGKLLFLLLSPGSSLYSTDSTSPFLHSMECEGSPFRLSCVH